MNLFVIILMLLAGTALVYLEIFFIPGIVTGILGIGIYIWGVYEAFNSLGVAWGWSLFGISLVFNFVIFYLTFKNLYRSRLANKYKIDSKVNEFDNFDLAERDEGKSVTDLRPEGKGLFEDKIVTVWSFGGQFISSNEAIEIVKIENNKIYVKKL